MLMVSDITSILKQVDGVVGLEKSFILVSTMGRTWKLVVAQLFWLVIYETM